MQNESTEQQAIYQEALSRYRAILSGMGIDTGFSELLADAESRGDAQGAAILLKSLADNQTTIKAMASGRQEEPALTPEEAERQALTRQIEDIMLSDWRGSSPAEEPAAEQATDTLRKQIEDIMLNGRDCRGYKPGSERSKRPAASLAYGART